MLLPGWLCLAGIILSSPLAEWVVRQDLAALALAEDSVVLADFRYWLAEG
jgi:hypothetical protein